MFVSAKVKNKTQTEPQPLPFTSNQTWIYKSIFSAQKPTSFSNLNAATAPVTSMSHPVFPGTIMSAISPDRPKQWPHSSARTPHAAYFTGSCRLPSDTGKALECKAVRWPQGRYIKHHTSHKQTENHVYTHAFISDVWAQMRRFTSISFLQTIIANHCFFLGRKLFIYGRLKCNREGKLRPS